MQDVPDLVNTVVVGAGQAGLAVSALLSEAAVDHVVFERGRIGESWRSQRWDSFMLNTPNWSNRLPGDSIGGEEHAFGSRDELVTWFERYADSFDAPIVEGTSVESVEHNDNGDFVVTTPGRLTRARNVVVASGAMSTPNMPDFAVKLASDIVNITAADYRTADALPPGGVMVVGSGQSGCQVAEDLLEAGRRVFLCASRVARIPRSYRGRDIFEWFGDMGFFELATEDLEDPAARYAAQPQVSGTHGGHTISLQSLARDGAVLLGRVVDVDGTSVTLEPNLDECVSFADERCASFKSAIDDYIVEHGLDAPPAEPDPHEPPMPQLSGLEQAESIDLAEENITTVIWCVGFHGDFSWLADDVIDDRGQPRQRDGKSEIPGLYFVGMPWLRKRKSGIIFGVAEDAATVCERIIAASP